MRNDVVNLSRALASFEETWDPRIVGSVNDYDIRIAHIDGSFVWHTHDDTDEFFLVVSGAMDIHMRDRTVSLAAGEIFVVPAGVEHKPVAEAGADIVMFEPSGTANTGDHHDELPTTIATTTGRWLAGGGLR